MDIINSRYFIGICQLWNNIVLGYLDGTMGLEEELDYVDVIDGSGFDPNVNDISICTFYVLTGKIITGVIRLDDSSDEEKSLKIFDYCHRQIDLNDDDDICNDEEKNFEIDILFAEYRDAEHAHRKYASSYFNNILEKDTCVVMEICLQFFMFSITAIIKEDITLYWVDDRYTLKEDKYRKHVINLVENMNEIIEVMKKDRVFDVVDYSHYMISGNVEPLKCVMDELDRCEIISAVRSPLLSIPKDLVREVLEDIKKYSCSNFPFEESIAFAKNYLASAVFQSHIPINDNRLKSYRIHLKNKHNQPSYHIYSCSYAGEKSMEDTE